MKNNENNTEKRVTLCQRVYITQINSPTDDWKEFHKIYDLLQGECITASGKCISICNMYASYLLDSGKEIADKFLMERYNLDKIGNILYSICRTECPSNFSKNINSISREIESKYFKGNNSYLNKIKSGEGNPPMTFTKSLPIPLVAQGAIITRGNGNNPRYYDFDFPYLSVKGRKSVSEMLYGKDSKKKCDSHIKFSTFAKSDYVYEVLENIVCGNYKLCGSKLKRVPGKNTKYEYILLLSYSKPVNKDDKLDANKVMGVDLGMVVPAMCAVNYNTYRRSSLGGNWIIRENVRQEKENRRTQVNITYNGRDGHGRKNKLDGYDGKGHIINNRNSTYNHVLAKRIVEQAIKWECGEIHIEDLSGISDGNSSRFLKNWTYFDLQQKIIEKAAKYGIVVKKVNARNTSKKCSCCGHISKDNRPKGKMGQAYFKCVKCGYEVNADFNAAMNIARSTEFSKSKKSN